MTVESRHVSITGIDLCARVFLLLTPFVSAALQQRCCAQLLQQRCGRRQHESSRSKICSRYGVRKFFNARLLLKTKHLPSVVDLYNWSGVVCREGRSRTKLEAQTSWM
jgi:hypothetical protein